ncbi:hypothetical protein ECANGB1_2659 [Enterospora canceri]|uniref:Uncharacterized protein n=1 Tax=Enterospora canceri TaxID=1081671 RepID=A0A1Y1S6G1_9MICR|nr:hypothetical protein ECANGB1_2659 [Enterospora canceri]
MAGGDSWERALILAAMSSLACARAAAPTVRDLAKSARIACLMQKRREISLSLTRARTSCSRC